MVPLNSCHSNVDRKVVFDVSQRIKGKSAKSSTSTLEEAADLLCESQEIEVVVEESTVHSDLLLAENVRSNGKEE